MRGPRVALVLVASFTLLTMGACTSLTSGQVTGEAVSASELDDALRLSHGTDALQRLLVEHVVLAEARRKGVTVDESELKPYLTRTASIADPSLRRAAEQELRAHFLLRKLILSNYTSGQLRQLYELFQDRLIQYQVAAVVARTRQDADAVLKGLNAGSTVAAMTEKYGINDRLKARHGDLGFLTLEAIESTFGPVVADAVEGTSAKTALPIFPRSGSFLVVEIGEVRSSFSELRSSLEDRIVEGAGPAYVHRLVRSANTSSKYRDQPTLMPQLEAFQRPLYAPFRQEAPPEFASVQYSGARDIVGAAVGSFLGRAVLPVASAIPATDSRAMGTNVGEEMGLKVPGTAAPLKGGSDEPGTGTATETPRATLGADVGEQMGLKIPTVGGAAHTE